LFIKVNSAFFFSKNHCSELISLALFTWTWTIFFFTYLKN
jgi:hypothetical protein